MFREVQQGRWVYHPRWKPNEVVRLIKPKLNRGRITVGKYSLDVPNELVGKRVKLVIEVIE